MKVFLWESKNNIEAGQIERLTSKPYQNWNRGVGCVYIRRVPIYMRPFIGGFLIVSSQINLQSLQKKTEAQR